MDEPTMAATETAVPEFADAASQTAWWTQCVAEWQASGRSQAAFAKALHIPVTTFNWWKRRVLQQAPGRKRVRRSLGGDLFAKQAVARAPRTSDAADSVAERLASRERQHGPRRSSPQRRSPRGSSLHRSNPPRSGPRSRNDCEPRAKRAEPAAFVPVRISPGETGRSWHLEVSCRNGRVLRVRDELAPERLAALVAVLETAAPWPVAPC